MYLKNVRAMLFKGSFRIHVVTFLYICIQSLTMNGCGHLNVQPKPISLGEGVSGYTYIPIDPTKVQIDHSECSISYLDIGDDIKKNKLKLLDMLPDNAVRMSMESSNSKGHVTYGVSKVGASGSAYKLTADYINSDTVNKTVWIRKTMLVKDSLTESDDQGKVTKHQEETSRRSVRFAQDTFYKDKASEIYTAEASEKSKGQERLYIPGTEQYDVKSLSGELTTKQRDDLSFEGYEEFSVPIYVGIGLRIVAEGFSLSGDANISGIGVIGAEAEAKRLVGSLTVQTLGVNSQAVASALPVQSELSRTTAENAFVAIGSIKAMLHQVETIKFPRVVGFYLPFPGGKPLVNALISELSRNPVRWCPNGYEIKNNPTQP